LAHISEEISDLIVDRLIDPSEQTTMQ